MKRIVTAASAADKKKAEFVLSKLGSALEEIMHYAPDDETAVQIATNIGLNGITTKKSAVQAIADNIQYWTDIYNN